MLTFIVNEQSRKISQPAGIKIPLKQHQLAILNSLAILDQNCKLKAEPHFIDNRERIHASECIVNSNVAVIGDRPGYGKTLTFLTLVQLFRDQPALTPQYLTPFRFAKNGNFGSFYEYKNLNQPAQLCPTTIVVVPANLISQWSTQISQFTHLNFVIFKEKWINILC